MFLHSRTPESHVDFVEAMKEAGWVNPFKADDGGDRDWVGGVVHSFTGTKEEVQELVSLQPTSYCIYITI